MLHGVMIPCNSLMRLVFVAFSGHLVLSPMSLTSSQKRYLRGLAHAIKPVIQIGNKGITDAVTAEFSLALDQHELVKVRLAGGSNHPAGRCRRRRPVAEHRHERMLLSPQHRCSEDCPAEVTATRWRPLCVDAHRHGTIIRHEHAAD